jgi:chorismate mutase
MLSPERGGILLRGIRGAVSVSENSRSAILDACTVLLRRMMDENHLDPEEMVAVFFTLTDDLNAAFPAEAARAMGLDRVPLLCLREVAVPGAMASVLRILMLVNRDGPLNSVRHVYLGEARKLRQDLEEIRTP